MAFQQLVSRDMRRGVAATRRAPAPLARMTAARAHGAHSADCACSKSPAARRAPRMPPMLPGDTQQALRFETSPAENTHEHVRPTAPGCLAACSRPTRGQIAAARALPSPSRGWTHPLCVSLASVLLACAHVWTHTLNAPAGRKQCQTSRHLRPSFACGEGMCARRTRWLAMHQHGIDIRG